MSKKSEFIAIDSVPDDYSFNVFGNGVDREITKPDLFAQIKDESFSPFIYPTIELLQNADLEADDTNPTYVRCEEAEYRLYKITNLAAGVDDITLDNGNTATYQVEYRDIGFVVGPATSVAGSLAIFTDTGGAQLDGLLVPTNAGKAFMQATDGASVSYPRKNADNTVSMLGASTYFDAIKQASSTGYSGTIKTASDASTLAQTAIDEAITPANLAALKSSSAEVMTGTNTVKYVTPANLQVKIDDELADKPTVIENFAALASTPAVAGKVYFLKEYHSGSGTGGDNFIARSGIYTPDNGEIFATATVGVYLLRKNRLTSPENYGFTGSNLVSDTVAVKKALELPYKKCVFRDGITYPVNGIVVSSVEEKTVEAGSARITSTYGGVLIFNACTNYKWVGGILNAGTGVDATIYDAGVPPTSYAHPFTFFDCDVFEVNGLTVDNGVAHTPTCITSWQSSIGKITNCVCIGGGDNSIWVFVSQDVSTTANIVKENEVGRSICYQGTSRGVIAANNVSDGKGDGVNVHGSDNIAIIGNSISNMAVDAVLLGTARGISVEWNEVHAGSSELIAAAIADLHLYNGVFSREIMISGNTVSNVSVAVQVGDNVGAGGVSYGNNGVVSFVGNSFSDCGEGIHTGRSSYVTAKANRFKDMHRGFITIDTAADTGGYIAHDITIGENDFDGCDLSSSGFTGIHFLTSAVYAATRLIVTSGNTFKRTASISNAALELLFGSSANNAMIITNGLYQQFGPPLNTLVAYGDESDVSNLTASMTTGKIHEFALKGVVTDAFTTIYAIPTDYAVIMDIQIGIADRLSHVSTVFAHNCNAPAIALTGISGTNIQLSGADIQIRGTTGGGAAPYGGLYIARIKVLSAT